MDHYVKFKSGLDSGISQLIFELNSYFTMLIHTFMDCASYYSLLLILILLSFPAEVNLKVLISTLLDFI